MGVSLSDIKLTKELNGNKLKKQIHNHAKNNLSVTAHQLVL